MKVNKAPGNLVSRFVSIASLATLVAVISVYMYQSFQIDEMMKDLHELHKKKEHLISETEALQADVNRLANIDRISRLAKEKFALVFNDEKQAVIQIGDDSELVEIKEKFAMEENKSQEISTAGIH